MDDAIPVNIPVLGWNKTGLRFLSPILANPDDGELSPSAIRLEEASTPLEALLPTKPACCRKRPHMKPIRPAQCTSSSGHVNTSSTDAMLGASSQEAWPSPPMQARQPAPVKPKKKRVRRETIEMKHLREQTRKLELRLEQLKKRPASVSEARSDRRPQRQADENDHRSHLSITSTRSVWEDLAERQINERMRAEWQNKTLQVAHLAQMKYALELGKQLQHLASDQALKVLSTRKQAIFWDLSSGDDADIYAEQLTQVARVYLMWKRQLQHPSTTLHFRSDLSKGEELVKLNPDVDAGVVFEMHCGTTVPFDLHVAAQAYWRMFTYEACQRQGSNRRDPDTTTDVVSNSFTLQVKNGDFTARVRGKQTSRRYVSADSITIVWTGSADPVEMSGAKFRGMQCQKSGWIKLRRAGSQGSGPLANGRATTVEMHSEMTPLFQPGVVDQGRQISALIDSLRRSHDQTNAIYCQMMQGLLLEEDWKATFGSDMLVF